MNQPITHSNQRICFACAKAEMQKHDLPAPGPIWCETSRCESCGTHATVSKARHFGLPVREAPQDWSHST